MIRARSGLDPVIFPAAPGPALESLGTREERLAFWINTYNALVVDGIRALGIRESVWEVPHFFERIGYRIDGFVFSADAIEHGILRGNRPHPLTGVAPFQSTDPRKAFAILPPDPMPQTQRRARQTYSLVTAAHTLCFCKRAMSTTSPGARPEE